MEAAAAAAAASATALVEAVMIETAVARLAGSGGLSSSSAPVTAPLPLATWSRDYNCAASSSNLPLHRSILREPQRTD